MATARTALELRRWSRLSTIRRTFAFRMPEFDDRHIGLGDIAELCRRQALVRPGRDWAVVRDQILTIGCEWDLERDRLEDQPDDCLHHLIVFLDS